MIGVLRVAKAGYLSGLNNLRVYSLLDKRYSEDFGVSQPELDEALEAEGLMDKSEAVKAYYDGYSTPTSQSLYNPWSVLNYLADKILQGYWVETGKTTFLESAMWSIDLEMKQQVVSLLNGNSVTVPFEKDINYKGLGDPMMLWSLLYFSGYVTGTRVDEGNINVRIPNSEVKRELSLLWVRTIRAKRLGGPYADLVNGLLSGNKIAVETNLRTLARELFRYVRPIF